MIVPSGQAGATIVFLTVLLPGDKVLIPNSAYRPLTRTRRVRLAMLGDEPAQLTQGAVRR